MSETEQTPPDDTPPVADTPPLDDAGAAEIAENSPRRGGLPGILVALLLVAIVVLGVLVAWPLLLPKFQPYLPESMRSQQMANPATPSSPVDLAPLRARLAELETTQATQAADQAHFRHLGVEPAAKDYVALKSSVHFRNDFEDLASAILIVSSPGEVYADPSTLDYRNIRGGIEITRMG